MLITSGQHVYNGTNKIPMKPKYVSFEQHVLKITRGQIPSQQSTIHIDNDAVLKALHSSLEVLKL